MQKKDEVSRPDSCLNKARDNELLFVLLGRDEAAPQTIRYWVQERIGRRKNQPEDKQIQEALALAATIEYDLMRAK